MIKLKPLILLIAVLIVASFSDVFAHTIRLNSTADIWLSDATSKERDSSAGKNSCIKLKSVQEMGAVRFDATPVIGKKVESAKLFLRVKGKDLLRHIRVSTISQSWEEGTARWSYSRGNGATFNFANSISKQLWSFPKSQFCDVSMGNGNTLTTYDELKRVGGGWFSVDLTPELIYAMVTGSTDGLAIMDGGTLFFCNNYVYSSDKKGSEPYINVEVKGPLENIPAMPVAKATSDYEHSGLKTGAILVSIKEMPGVFSWNIKLNDKPVERWKIPFPRTVQQTGLEQEHITARSVKESPINFILRGLTPEKMYNIGIVAIDRGGNASPTATLRVKASSARKATPREQRYVVPQGPCKPLCLGDKLKVWVVPGLIKIDPLTSQSIHNDLVGMGDGNSINAVWNGKNVSLHGAKGEYVSFQVVIKRDDTEMSVDGIKLVPNELSNGLSVIGNNEFELFKNWYSKPGNDDRWYPAFNIPLKSSEDFHIPDPKRGLQMQANQSVLVDIYIPKSASSGIYKGFIDVIQSNERLKVPIEISVYDFSLPDVLSFWCEFNSYIIPGNHLDYHRLAHQNRCVFNPWRYKPRVNGTGGSLSLDWSDYDNQVGPLLSGKAFKNNRRTDEPTPVMYLPFEDSWPVHLNKDTYKYNGPWVSLEGWRMNRSGEEYQNAVIQLNEHYLKSEYIGSALSKDYIEGFTKAATLFVKHFKAMGWNNTEMQCFYGGKKTHRIDYGSEMWWQTDEPIHWDDWMALQFFGNLWTKTIQKLEADSNIWVARGDISRPKWQGKVLNGVIQAQYGCMGSEPDNTRLKLLKEQTGVRLRDYGGLGYEGLSYSQVISKVLNTYLSGGDAFLPWQTLGGDDCLDKNKTTTLFVPGKRFGLKVVSDMRLKAFRDAEQLIEYCVLLSNKYKLSRESIRKFINQFIKVGLERTSANPDNADANQASTFCAWQVSEVRKQVAKLIAD